MSVVICVNRLMSGVIALSYQSMSEAMTSGGSFYFFGALSFISVAFYYFMVRRAAVNSNHRTSPPLPPLVELDQLCEVKNLYSAQLAMIV